MKAGEKVTIWLRKVDAKKIEVNLILQLQQGQA